MCTLNGLNGQKTTTKTPLYLNRSEQPIHYTVYTVAYLPLRAVACVCAEIFCSRDSKQDNGYWPNISLNVVHCFNISVPDSNPVG